MLGAMIISHEILEADLYAYMVETCTETVIFERVSFEECMVNKSLARALPEGLIKQERTRREQRCSK